MAGASARPRRLLELAAIVAIASLGLAGCLQPGVVYKAGVSPGFTPGLWRTAGSGADGCEFARLRSLTGDTSKDAITHDLSFRHRHHGCDIDTDPSILAAWRDVLTRS